MSQDHHQLVYIPASENSEAAPVNTGNQGSSTWTWILIVIAIIVIIVGVVLIIWWATSGGDDNGSDSGTLAITGVDFVTNTSTSITGTWTRVGSPDDIVTMYVNPSGEEMKFDKNGSPLGNYSTSGRIVSPGTTATVTNLTPNATYDAILVVTNPNVSCFNGSHHQSGITPSPPLAPGTKFNIASSAQKGQITYTPSSVSGQPPDVTYKLNVNNPNNSLFFQDSNGFICATTQSELLTTDSECADNSFVLNAGTLSTGTTSTGTTNLTFIRKSDLTDTTSAFAQWTFNNGQEWCVNSNTATPRCMLYTVSSPVLLTPANGTTTTNGTTTIEPIESDQNIFVTTGSGSMWNNTKFTN